MSSSAAENDDEDDDEVSNADDCDDEGSGDDVDDGEDGSSGDDEGPKVLMPSASQPDSAPAPAGSARLQHAVDPRNCTVVVHHEGHFNTCYFSLHVVCDDSQPQQTSAWCQCLSAPIREQ